MKLSIDQFNRFDSKPDKANFSSINENIVYGWNDYSIEQIVEYITNGHTISTSNYKAKRKALDWQGQQCFGIDIDLSTSPTPTRAIASINKIFNVDPIITYNTFSSNSFNNKYRIVVAADEVITEPKLALAILRGLTDVLKADTACIDLARIFYGTTPNKLIQSSNNTISINDLIEFSKPYETVSGYDTEQVERKPVNVSSLSKDQKKLLDRHIKTKWNRVLLAGEQSRYMSLKTIVLGTREKHLYDFTFFPMMGLDFMSPELSEGLAELVITSSSKLTKLYVDEYDKNYKSIVRKLAQWAMK